MDLSVFQIFLAIFIVTIGTSIQASIGFGLAMVAAPLLVLVDRAFVPAPLILSALVLATWMAYSERHVIDYKSMRVALLGRCLGSPPAAWLLGSMSLAAFDIMFAVLVLVGVGISLLHNTIQPTPKAVFIACVASGFMSTISSIGGPPLALVYQNVKGSELRANLSVLFILGCSVSLIALAFVGKFVLLDIAYAAILMVGISLGAILSKWLRRILDKHTARPYLLALCCVSASFVLIKAVFSLG